MMMPGGGGGSSTGSSNAGGGIGAVGSSSSSVRQSGKEAEDHAVVDLVNAMFNSGAGSSMDLIFPSMEERREEEEKPGEGGRN